MQFCVVGLLLCACCFDALAEQPESKPAECLLQSQSKRVDAEALHPLGLVEGEHGSEIGESTPDDDAKQAALKAKGLAKSLQAAKKTEIKLDENLDKMQVQLKEQQQTHVAVANEIEQIEKDLIIARESLSVCEADLVSFDDELGTVKKDIAEQLVRGTNLADSINSLKAALEEARRKKNNLEGEKATTEKELAKVHSETEAKANAARKFEQLIKEGKKATRKAEAELRAKIDQTRADAEAEQSRVNELKTSIQATQDEVARMTAEQNHLHAFLKDSKEAAEYLKPYNLLATSSTRHNSTLHPNAVERQQQPVPTY